MRTVAVEDTKEEVLETTIAIARSQVIKDGEPVTIWMCLSDSHKCPTRPKGGHGCDFCNRITVDQNGNVVLDAVN